MFVTAAKASEAATVLGVELTSLTPDTLKIAYRKKVKECHPDYHGTTKLELWSRVSWAKDCLTHWLARRKQSEEPASSASGDCRACGGVGRIKVRRSGIGFNQEGLTVMCVMCNGTGRK